MVIRLESSDFAFLALEVGYPSKPVTYYKLAESGPPFFGSLDVKIRTVDHQQFWFVIDSDQGVSKAYFDAVKNEFHGEMGRAKAGSESLKDYMATYTAGEMPQVSGKAEVIFERRIVEMEGR